MTAHCAKCGACLPVCPVYRQTLLERLSPRGKHALLKDGAADYSWASVRETVSACLQCGACGAQCSAGIEVNREILYARTHNREFAPSFPALWKLFGSDLAWSGASALVRTLPASSGIIFRLAALSSNTADDGSHLPPPAASPLTSRRGMARFHHAADCARKKRGKFSGMRIALFTGCVQNLVYPEIPEAMTRWFPGAEFVIPEHQCCCGLPALSAGAIKPASNLIIRNIKAFEKARADMILTGCASCSYMIRKWHELLDRQDDKQKAMNFAERLKEFTQAADPAIMEGHLKKIQGTITFHAPCHSRFSPEGAETSENFIKRIAKDTFAQMEQGCCGHGGSFSIKFPSISQGVFQERLAALKKTRASTVVTTCSGCLMQWKTGLSGRNGANEIKVIHAAELL